MYAKHFFGRKPLCELVFPLFSLSYILRLKNSTSLLISFRIKVIELSLYSKNISLLNNFHVCCVFCREFMEEVLSNTHVS